MPQKLQRIPQGRLLRFTKISFAIATAKTINQLAAATRYSIVIDWFLSRNPSFMHGSLLFVGIVASVCVAIGIVLESPKWSLANVLVIGGVAIEAVCTLLLFGFDEGISSAQQLKIIALEKRLAPRVLDSNDRESMIAKLRLWAILPGSSVKRKAVFLSYLHATHESQIFQNALADAFTAAGWESSPVAAGTLMATNEDAFPGVQIRAGSAADPTAQEAAQFVSASLESYGPTSVESNDVNSGCKNEAYKLDGACRGLQITVGEHP
jgi:hypothetical protein